MDSLKAKSDLTMIVITFIIFVCQGSSLSIIVIFLVKTKIDMITKYASSHTMALEGFTCSGKLCLQTANNMIRLKKVYYESESVKVEKQKRKRWADSVYG